MCAAGHVRPVLRVGVQQEEAGLLPPLLPAVLPLQEVLLPQQGGLPPRHVPAGPRHPHHPQAQD